MSGGPRTGPTPKLHKPPDSFMGLEDRRKKNTPKKRCSGTNLHKRDTCESSTMDKLPASFSTSILLTCQNRLTTSDSSTAKMYDSPSSSVIKRTSRNSSSLQGHDRCAAQVSIPPPFSSFLLPPVPAPTHTPTTTLSHYLKRKKTIKSKRHHQAPARKFSLLLLFHQIPSLGP